MSAACRPLSVSLPDESVEQAICQSSRCFHNTLAVSSWPPPPVGRGSSGLMLLAARHTAISRTRAVAYGEVILDLAGEVGDELGSPCQVVAPAGMGLERWNALAARAAGRGRWV
jgi:hypothetical protein